MNEIWVLSIRTSLPKVCKSPDDFKMTVSAYDSFEKAKTAMREEINKYAFAKNAMFNGAGQIKLLKSYIKEMGEPSAESIRRREYCARDQVRQIHRLDACGNREKGFRPFLRI